MEEPNVDRLLEEMARQEIDLPTHPRRWVVHVSQENLLPSRYATASCRRRATADANP